MINNSLEKSVCIISVCALNLKEWRIIFLTVNKLLQVDRLEIETY